MKTCNDIRRTFLDHDWDQAAVHDAAAIVEHLKQCEECRTAISQYEQLRTLLRIPGPRPTPDAPVEPVAVAARPEVRSGRTVAAGRAMGLDNRAGGLLAGRGCRLDHVPPRASRRSRGGRAGKRPRQTARCPPAATWRPRAQPCNGRRLILPGRCKSLKTSPKRSGGKPVGWPWAIAAAIWA